MTALRINVAYEADSAVRETLRDTGLTWIQYSCFLGDLDGDGRSMLSTLLSGLVKDERDSVYMLPLCERCLRLLRIISLKKRIQKF